MSLTEYKKKRSFKRTPEPAGEIKEKKQSTSRKKLTVTKSSTHKTLSFVVQKHKASHLHYDFRLEMRGVLKSWAVPKGPSINPQEKRLAMLVEDHPFEYKDFEGIIPEGNYGAGVVIIWDQGTYELASDDGEHDVREQEKILVKNFYSGKLRFELKGKKLKGKFTLVKAPERGETSWLLIKEKDKYAKAIQIAEKDRSVISNKTIEELAESRNVKKWKSNSKKSDSKTEKEITSTHIPQHDDTASFSGQGDTTDYKEIMDGVLTAFPNKKKLPIPKNISPMLASSTTKPFDHPEWIYEVQWNGSRTIGYLNEGKVELKSGENKSLNKKFYPVYEAMKQWSVNAVVDGEIVVVNEEGLSDDAKIKEWKTPEDGEIVYYVFDLLWLDGYDLCQLSLEQRRGMLQRLVPEDSAVRFSESFAVKGTEFFASAKKLGIRAIVAKKLSSTYKVGTRTRNWLTIATS